MKTLQKEISEEAVSSSGTASFIKYAVILAAGEGKRAGGGIPKQFQELNGFPMFWWSVKAFHDENPSTCILLVLHPGYFDDWDIFYDSLEEDWKEDIQVVCGGRDRKESTANALMSVTAEENVLVAVHDAARPLVSRDMIGRGWTEAAANGAAVPVIPVTDSLRRLTPDGTVSVRRSEYVVVQTPQVFKAAVLKKAFDNAGEGEFTDDASIVEADGVKVTVFDGDCFNMKVTNPMDMAIASLLMEKRKAQAAL